MKHTELTLPKDISRASGISLARLFAKWTAVLTIVVLFVIARTASSDLLWPLALRCFALIIITSALAYLSGKFCFKERHRYLLCLRKKYIKNIKSLERKGDDVIEQEADMQMAMIREQLHLFFDPLVRKFLRIRTSSPGAWDKFRKVNKILNERMVMMKDPLLWKVGNFLQGSLTDAFSDAIAKKSRADFDTNWIERLTFTGRRIKIVRHIRAEVRAKKILLYLLVDKVDDLISNCQNVISKASY